MNDEDIGWWKVGPVSNNFRVSLKRKTSKAQVDARFIVSVPKSASHPGPDDGRIVATFKLNDQEQRIETKQQLIPPGKYVGELVIATMPDEGRTAYNYDFLIGPYMVVRRSDKAPKELAAYYYMTVEEGAP